MVRSASPAFDVPTIVRLALNQQVSPNSLIDVTEPSRERGTNRPIALRRSLEDIAIDAPQWRTRSARIHDRHVGNPASGTAGISRAGISRQASNACGRMRECCGRWSPLNSVHVGIHANAHSSVEGHEHAELQRLPGQTEFTIPLRLAQSIRQRRDDVHPRPHPVTCPHTGPLSIPWSRRTTHACGEPPSDPFQSIDCAVDPLHQWAAVGNLEAPRTKPPNGEHRRYHLYLVRTPAIVVGPKRCRRHLLQIAPPRIPSPDKLDLDRTTPAVKPTQPPAPEGLAPPANQRERCRHCDQTKHNARRRVGHNPQHGPASGRHHAPGAANQVPPRPPGPDAYVETGQPFRNRIRALFPESQCGASLPCFLRLDVPPACIDSRSPAVTRCVTRTGRPANPDNRARPNAPNTNSNRNPTAKSRRRPRQGTKITADPGTRIGELHPLLRSRKPPGTSHG